MKLRIFSVRKPLKLLLVTLGWATSTTALALAAIFQGQLLPRNINGGGLYSEVISSNPVWLWTFYLGNFAVCIIAAMLISDPGKAVVAFFASFIVAAAITYLVLILPDLVGYYDPAQLLQEAASVFTLSAFFPILMLVNLAGTVLGVALGEHFL